MKAFCRVFVTAATVILAAGLVSSRGQQGDDSANLQPARPGTQFHFEVVETFDAKYLGDTPGHMGRSGGLVGVRPSIALGDPVYRSGKKVGSITSVVWSRVQGSLTIEFDPEPKTRIAIGDQMTIDLNSTPAADAR